MKQSLKKERERNEKKKIKVVDNFDEIGEKSFTKLALDAYQVFKNAEKRK